MEFKFLLAAVVITVIVVGTCADECPEEYEVKWIKKYNRCLKKGYNSTIGCEKPVNGSLTSEKYKTCKKIERKLTGKCNYTCEDDDVNNHCPVCVELDWGDLDYEAYNLSNSVHPDVPICSDPYIIPCQLSSQMCGSVTVEMSVSGTTDGYDWIVPFDLLGKTCVNTTETCDMVEEGVMDFIAGNEDVSHLEFAVTHCEFSYCDDDGENCVDVENEDDDKNDTVNHCPVCVELDWGDLDYEAYNLSNSIHPAVPICSEAAIIPCQLSSQMCGSVTVEMSVSGTTDGTDWAIPFDLLGKTCVNTTETCDFVQQSLMDYIEGNEEVSHLEFAVADCEFSYCDEDGENCVDVENEDSDGNNGGNNDTVNHCPVCAELDWGDLDYEAHNLSNTVHPAVPICSEAAIIPCQLSSQMCGSVTVEMSVNGTSNGTDWSVPFKLLGKTCVNTTETCDTVEEGVMAFIEGNDEVSHLEFAVSECQFSYCDDNHENCVDVENEDSDALVDIVERLNNAMVSGKIR